MEKPANKYAPTLSVYLGPGDLGKERLEALKRLSEQLSVSQSKMIQMIADGKLLLTVAPGSTKS